MTEVENKGGGDEPCNIKIQESKTVEFTENGDYTVFPDEGYDAVAQVNVTVDVPAPSGGNVLVLKRNNVTIPQRDEGGEFGPPSSYPIPFNLIESNDCNSIYCYTTEINTTDMGYQSPEFFAEEKTLPFTISYVKDYMNYSSDNYSSVVILGTDTPGATLTIDTTYFDIVELPSGYSADFSVEVTE